MKKRIIVTLMALALAGGLAACDDESSILDPGTDPQGIELDLQVDEDLTDLVLTDADAGLSGLVGPPAFGDVEADPPALLAEPDPGALDAARLKLQEARQLFVQARQAWRNGDTETAAELAFQARLRVAEAWVMVFGEEAFERHRQRVEQVISWLEQRVDEESSQLLARIRELRDEADAIRSEGPTSEENLIRATERSVLALQIANREQAQMRRGEMAQHARLQVFMAQSAIGLAQEVAGDDATERQVYAWRHAQHLTVHAGEALDAGRFRLAFALAREAENVALVVVMLEPGLDQARVQAMVELTERAISAAEEALVGSDPQTFAARLLEHARQLQAKGNELAFSRPRIAVHVLWHAAVTAYGVIQLAT
jgi:hypothetical protein